MLLVIHPNGILVFRTVPSSVTTLTRPYASRKSMFLRALQELALSCGTGYSIKGLRPMSHVGMLPFLEDLFQLLHLQLQLPLIQELQLPLVKELQLPLMKELQLHLMQELRLHLMQELRLHLMQELQLLPIVTFLLLPIVLSFLHLRLPRQVMMVIEFRFYRFLQESLGTGDSTFVCLITLMTMLLESSFVTWLESILLVVLWLGGVLEPEEFL